MGEHTIFFPTALQRGRIAFTCKLHVHVHKMFWPVDMYKYGIALHKKKVGGTQF